MAQSVAMHPYFVTVDNPYLMNILYEEEDDYDDKAAEYLALYPPRVPRVFRHRTSLMESYDDEEFRVRFRVPKRVAIELLGELGDLEVPDRKGALIPIQQLLIALSFYACGSFQISVGNLSGVSKATVCRVISRISRCIARMYNQKITMPSDQSSVVNMKRKFYQIARFPGVIGAIGCTHVAIQSPGGEFPELYRNEKGYFSMNVQAVSDPDLRFINIVARWYGSADDVTVFEHSFLYGRLVNGYFQDGHLLGDARYPCESYLLTPVEDPKTPAEQRYNAAHNQTRKVVLRALSLLKRRFSCLKYGLRIKGVTPVIVACCVLHNMCIDLGDKEAPEELTVNGRQQVPEEVPVPAYDEEPDANCAKRTALILYHFT